MAKRAHSIEFTITANISLWDAIKLRIAGADAVDRYIAAALSRDGES